jgi:hypothetical protein
LPLTFFEACITILTYKQYPKVTTNEDFNIKAAGKS